jgi:hypothetical protein
VGGARVRTMTVVLVSAVGTGAGLYLGWWAAERLTTRRAGASPRRLTPRMQPTGRGGPMLHSGVTLPEAKERTRWFVWAGG